MLDQISNFAENNNFSVGGEISILTIENTKYSVNGDTTSEIKMSCSD
jgi:hypothetical protein